MRDLNVWIADTPFDPNGRERVVYYRSKNKKYYKIFIYLTGPDVPFVKGVTYTLHPFQVQHHNVQRSLPNPNCKLAVWVWGKFEVLASVEDKKGNIYKLSHYLNFDSYFDPKKFEDYKLSSQEI